MGKATQRDREAPDHDSRHLVRVTTIDGAVSDDTIGSALTRRREELGLSRVRAAERVGMSRTTYSSYEMDAQRPSVDVFPALAAFLDVSIKKFLSLYSATVIAGLQPSLDAVLKVLDEATEEQESVEDNVLDDVEDSSPPVVNETSDVTVDEDTYWLGLLPHDDTAGDAAIETPSSGHEHDEESLPEVEDESATPSEPHVATTVPIAETIVRDTAVPKKKKKKKKKKKN